MVFAPTELKQRAFIPHVVDKIKNEPMPWE